MRAAARDAVAVAAALATYRSRILPQVHRELDGWRAIAAQISDPDLRAEALAAIDEKGANVEATAVFATLAPRRARPIATRAMVALQVAIDYLDTTEELRSGGEGGYLRRLFASYEDDARTLPSHGAVSTLLQGAVARCGEGQRHTHAAEHGDPAALETWSRELGALPPYRWWEVAAGASSSVAAHALIAAAADPRMSATEAELIDAAYFPSIGALTVLLDDLVDRDEDAASGAHSYVSYYADSEDAAARLELIAHLGRSRLARLPHPHRHAAILAGVVGFYLSAGEAGTPYARPIRDRLLGSAGPAVRPIVAFMRRRREKDPEAPGVPPGH